MRDDKLDESALILKKKFDCIEHIMLREQHLVTIQKRSSMLDACFSKMASDNFDALTDDLPKLQLWPLLKAAIHEVVALFDQIRSATLVIVQTAAAWHLAKRGRPHAKEEHIGLMYEGQNYLIKMRSDLAFLGFSPTMKHFFGHHLSTANLLFPANKTTLEEACLDAADRLDLESRTLCRALVDLSPSAASPLS